MTVRILGIDFRTDAETLPDRLDGAGLVVAPSGPGLAHDLPRSPAYRRSLENADWVLPDSGLMVLVWNVLSPKARLARYSGLKLLRDILPRPDVRAPGATFWVMPSTAELDRNLTWLQGHGFPALSEANCHVAPRYEPAADGAIVDETLLRVIEERKPKIVFLNVGGGVQEPLGWYLRQRLSYRPAILCTGAAIAFLTGGQAPIPPWADRLYLGWLHRILRDPVRFGKRYGASFGLVGLLARYRDRPPPSTC